MHNKIVRIFNFLNDNQHYNSVVQNNYWHSILIPYKNNTERAYSMLHHTFYSQSQAKLDKAKRYFEAIYRNQKALKTFKGFCEYHKVKSGENPYKSLFKSLVDQEGWGEKTSALFIKNIFQLHHHSQQTNLRFWEDVPVLSKADKIYLPVDAVIIDIFQRIDSNLKTFKNINNYINQKEEWRNKILWDDLWFWGYITQKGSKSPRELVVNDAKYWSQIFFNKDPKEMQTIKLKSKQFISILNRK
ncbi:MAG TPA: hypothetical protein VK498_05735 [Ferruginibacter sp.]|nr:hypothetical protein [Ferruginibacter sp.]